MLSERLNRSTARSPSAEPLPRVACFSIQAGADPSVMPRVLELFAKRGMIPQRWHSDLGGRRRDELTIDLQVDGLDRAKAELIAHAIRQMVTVTSVLTSEKSYA
ncbi:hypothetical protein GCM10017083_06000 [Thalassobaculum fulvum]|jgi:acetolactate synthase small subunit|uniref:ACT domain-containing protein n=1 Tax=Thalassobaculum fulvum TaxID=1633335 RepID=A0A918XPT3_9PROT|nr:hypothetical protein [Thalassobaculum fulvum]GHD41484.1 hypothetical protein GCM10017083_06000 [Thalassobaculum fulvum]